MDWNAIPEFKERCDDPVWRFQNLWSFKPETGGAIQRFTPRETQVSICRAVYEKNWRSIIVPKSRRVGVSTAVEIMLADYAFFNQGVNCALVDKTVDLGKKKIRDMVRPAFHSMPKTWMDNIIWDSDNQQDIVFRAAPDDVASTIYVTNSGRGGNVNFAHISEWGTIHVEEPFRSEEILTGFLPSCRTGIRIVETTWKGGKVGHVWDIMEGALAMAEEHKSDKDWRVLFFPWHVDPEAVLPGRIDWFPKELKNYFQELEDTFGILLSAQQKRWYYTEAWGLKAKRFGEFPSRLEECFMSPIPGAIYADLIDTAFAQGRVSEFNWIQAPVVTTWDIGSPKNTSVVYWQRQGLKWMVIDHDGGKNWAPGERVAQMLAKPFAGLYAAHVLPHDAANTGNLGLSLQEELERHGLRGTAVLPRTNDPEWRINETTEMFPNIWFRRGATDDLVENLAAYRRKVDRKSNWEQTKIVTAECNHDADAFGMITEAIAAGYDSGSLIMLDDGPKEPEVSFSSIEPGDW